MGLDVHRNLRHTLHSSLRRQANLLSSYRPLPIPDMQLFGEECFIPMFIYFVEILHTIHILCRMAFSWIMLLYRLAKRQLVKLFRQITLLLHLQRRIHFLSILASTALALGEVSHRFRCPIFHGILLKNMADVSSSIISCIIIQ